MKKLFRLPVFIYALVAGLAITQLACTSSDRNEAQRESDEAYTDFKDYVSNTGSRIDTAMTDTERDWDAEMAQRRAEYKEKESRVETHMDTYDEERRREINEMRTRYSEDWDRQEMAYENYTRRNTMRTEIFGPEMRGNDLSFITAANVRNVYENFVRTAQANQNNYTMADWRNMEVYWENLQDRTKEIENQISAADKREIAKERTKYSAIKNKAKTNIRAGNTGDDIKEGGKSTRSTINEKADKVGGKIEDTGKKAVDKVRD